MHQYLLFPEGLVCRLGHLRDLSHFVIDAHLQNTIDSGDTDQFIASSLSRAELSI